MKAKLFLFSGEEIGEITIPKLPAPQFILTTITGKADVFELQEKVHGGLIPRQLAPGIAGYEMAYEYWQVLIFDASKWEFERALLPTV